MSGLVMMSGEDSLVFRRHKDVHNCLIIDRMTGTMRIDSLPSSLMATSTRELAGILGLLYLAGGTYVVAASHVYKMGDVTPQNLAVYRLSSVELISLHRSELHLSASQRQENETFLTMVKQVLRTPHFYTSTQLDLSNSAQRRRTAYEKSNDESKERREDSKWDLRFVWNAFLLQRFIELGPSALAFCLPLIHGTVFIRQCSINGKLFRYTLISRRSCRNAGARYFRRGVNWSGECATLVETEQLVEHRDLTASFVQTRASVPLFWYQRPSILQLKPSCVVEDEKPNLEAFVRHYEEQMAIYGEQVSVNLIDHTGSEGRLERRLRSLHECTSIPGLYYIPFDFHKECSKMRWDRLSLLIDQLQPHQQRLSYFLESSVSVPSSILSFQSGVIRTNCIDNLDRTNVVQSLLALENLQVVLTKMGVLQEGQRIERNCQDFYKTFRNIWADQADLLSLQYAATPALKTDFTRTGKRSGEGAMRDLRLSAMRFVRNNFFDGYRQDSFDLFLGNYIVALDDFGNPIPSYYASRKRSGDSWLLYLPAVFVVTLAMFLLTFLFFSTGSDDEGLKLFLLFWLSLLILIAYFIVRRADEFIDWPKLVPMTITSSTLAKSSRIHVKHA